MKPINHNPVILCDVPTITLHQTHITVKIYMEGPGNVTVYHQLKKPSQVKILNFWATRSVQSIDHDQTGTLVTRRCLIQVVEQQSDQGVVYTICSSVCNFYDILL